MVKDLHRNKELGAGIERMALGSWHTRESFNSSVSLIGFPWSHTKRDMHLISHESYEMLGILWWFLRRETKIWCCIQNSGFKHLVSKLVY